MEIQHTTNQFNCSRLLVLTIYIFRPTNTRLGDKYSWIVSCSGNAASNPAGCWNSLLPLLHGPSILHGPSMDWHTCFYIAELVKWTNWFATVHHWNEPSNIFRLDSVISVFSKNLEIMWSVDKLRSYPIAIIFVYVPGPQSGPWGHNLCL